MKISIPFVFLFLAAFAGAEDAGERADRQDGMIESLNATSERRARVLEQIYAELRGPNAREMQDVLRGALSRENVLILRGAVEAIAMHGDPADVSYLEALLATSRRLEVKTLIIRLLPAFSLGGSERARFNYIRYASEYERAADPAVLEPLRRPPLTRRGKIDKDRERMRTRVVATLVGQFDPVAAALGYVNDRIYGASARLSVVHYVGAALGKEPGQWPALWASQGNEVELSQVSEVEEIRLAVLLSLADMGAEGQPDLLSALGRLIGRNGDILDQACYDSLAEMCRVGFQANQSLAKMEFALSEAAEGDVWRRQRLKATEDLAVFSEAKAESGMTVGRDPGVFVAAAACLGTAMSYPVGYPDPEGALAAAKERATTLLERMVMMPDLGRAERAALVSALGGMGTERAVAAVSGIVASPYCSPDFGEDGRLLAEAAVDALRMAATGNQAGRDAARALLLSFLSDTRRFPPLRPGTPPVGLDHMVLWRMQRLARSNETSMNQEAWRQRLGW